MHSGAKSQNPPKFELAEIVPKKPNAPPSTPDAPRENSFETAANLFAPQMHRRCNRIKVSVLRQKKFTVDFLTKTMKVNEGEVPQYYVEHSHPAIITPEEWEIVQYEIARRRSYNRTYSGNNLLASRMICADCGGFYGTKVWNSNNPKYRRIVWQCNNKFKEGHSCKTPHFSEEQIKARFLAAVNILLDDNDEVLVNCEEVKALLTDCTEIDKEIESLLSEIEVVTGLTQKLVEDNARTAQDQSRYR